MKIKFNHEAEDMADAFGLSHDSKIQVYTAIIYEALNSLHKIYSLYDGWDDAPLFLKKRTGMLERILERLNDQEGYFALTTYTDLLDNLVEPVKEMKEMKRSKKANKKPVDALLTIRAYPIINEIKTLKKINFNFELYKDRIGEMLSEDNLKASSLDALIKKALKRDDDDK